MTSTTWTTTTAWTDNDNGPDNDGFDPFPLKKSGHIVRSSFSVKRDKSATYRGRKQKNEEKRARHAVRA